MPEMNFRGILLCWLCPVVLTVPAGAVTGDVNLDGKVDFQDFFLLADNFGAEGPPDTLRVTVYDTIRIEQVVTVHDTIYVEFVEPPEQIELGPRTVAELDTIQIEFGAVDANDDGLQDGLRIGAVFYHVTDDLFSPLERVRWTGIWFTISYRLCYQVVVADTLQEYLLKEFQIKGNRADDALFTRITLANDEFLSPAVVEDLRDTVGYIFIKGTLHLPGQGDYATASEMLIEFDSDGNWLLARSRAG